MYLGLRPAIETDSQGVLREREKERERGFLNVGNASK